MGKSIILGAAGLAMAFGAAPAHAAYYSKTVVLNTASPTYHPLEDGTPPTALSASLSSLPYEAFTFSVSASGSYSLALSASGGFKPYLAIYSQSFDPNAPLANVLAANHFTNAAQFGTSITMDLVAGQTYVAALGGILFAASGAGPFAGSYLGVFGVNGPGTLTPGPGAAAVPEPASWGMMLMGFGVLGGALRYRRKGAARVAFARA